MVDARLITSGATGRNGGHIKAVPELSYAELMPVIGREKAQEVVLFTMKNVKDLLKVAASLSPDLQHRGEVRHVEALNIFTDEDQMSRISSTIKAFDDNPEFRGRSRLIDKKTLTEVRRPYFLAAYSSQSLTLRKSMMFAMQSVE